VDTTDTRVLICEIFGFLGDVGDALGKEGLTADCKKLTV
jgi:hypothetical protein